MCVQDAIRKPIIRTENKLVKKEASEIFKFIQMYMGDRPLLLGKAGLTPFSIAVDVVCRGWTNIALRDEILIQLCRQTTRNPLPLVTPVSTLSTSCCQVLAAENQREGCGILPQDLVADVEWMRFSGDLPWLEFVLLCSVTLLVSQWEGHLAYKKPTFSALTLLVGRQEERLSTHLPPLASR